MSDVIGTIVLKPGKEKAPERHHPWVFSKAVDESSAGFDEPGLVRVVDASGRFIAYGWHDRASHIPLRLLSWDEQVVPDHTWWAGMLKASVKRRFDWFSRHDRATNAFRLVHGEADMLAGLAVDLYGSTIVVLISARIAWDHRGIIVKTLDSLLHPQLIIVQTDRSFTRIERIPETVEAYRPGHVLAGEVPVEPITFMENGLLYSFIPALGQKSGHFCDQRENRISVAPHASGERVLDLFCYSGGFTMNALRAGCVAVDAVDSSQGALDMLRANIEANVSANKLAADALGKVNAIRSDSFEYLRSIETGLYGLIILDPPKLAKTQSQVDGAMKAYKDINRVAMGKVRQGGLVASFSCSGAISREQFNTLLAWAAKDAGKEVQTVRHLGQPLDHPIRLSFPESEYLKGCLLRVL
jgi:23S rRNA (cytosine1962-C5)-methyltransferase